MAFRKRFVGELRFHQDEAVGVNQVAKSLSCGSQRQQCSWQPNEKGSGFSPLPLLSALFFKETFLQDTGWFPRNRAAAYRRSREREPSLRHKAQLTPSHIHFEGCAIKGIHERVQMISIINVTNLFAGRSQFVSFTGRLDFLSEFSFYDLFLNERRESMSSDQIWIAYVLINPFRSCVWNGSPTCG